ncbi:hypothetical protein H0266_18495 [Halobacillus locisalis]|uniref:Uncharacterized protein n=1 Tax=Halobacillus locisalis TaxID=220753 RepID=A0A838CY74_9BACI|nr:DUF6744 family protein [Halobacillus locisalis]MBA2176873.1 hypothetical protein [Halobacillus locisalis]
MNINEQIQSGNIVATQNQEGALGFIFWYSVSSNIEVTREDLGDLFKNIGIDENWLPNEIRPSDAFRRATSEIQRKRVPTSDPNINRNYLSREVYSDTQMVQRNIVIENVDKQGKRLDYESNATVIELDKENVEFKVISKPGEDAARELAYEAKHKFDKYITYYSSQQLRVMVSKFLSSLAPTQVRPNGGVYFIPINFADDLSKLQTLCEELDSEGVSIPLYDSSDNRNMVLRKLKDDLHTAIQRLETLKQSNASRAQLQEALKEAKRVGDTYTDYRKNLKIDVSELEDYRDDLRSQYIEVLDRITK